MVLPIVHYGDSILRKKGKVVERFDESLTQLALNMVETMHEAEGIGLAAQQIGLDLMLFVIDLRDTARDFNYEFNGTTPPLDLIMPMAVANPVIEPTPMPVESAEEGCLSFPEIRGDIERPEGIRLNYQDLQGTPHELVCDGLLARCIQHEFDHLNGILFIDRMNKGTRAAIEADLRRLKKQTLKTAR